MRQTFAPLEACIPRLKATVTARSWDYLWFHQFQWAIIYRNPQNCCILCSFSFSIPQDWAAYKTLLRVSTLFYIYGHLKDYFLWFCLLTLLLFCCQSRHFPINWLSSGYLTNCHRGYYILLFFFSASVTRLHNCIGPELVPADLDTRELNHNRSKFFIKSTLKQIISCISGEQALEFSLLSLQGKSAQYSKTPLVFSVVYLRCFAYVSVNSKDWIEFAAFCKTNAVSNGNSVVFTQVYNLPRLRRKIRQFTQEKAHWYLWTSTMLFVSLCRQTLSTVPEWVSSADCLNFLVTLWNLRLLIY